MTSPAVSVPPTGGTSESHSHRFLPLVGVIVISLAVVGFMLGLREPERVVRVSPVPSLATHAPPAETYSELPGKPLGPNAKVKMSLADLKFDKPGILDPVTRTEDQKTQALADRARNRAYDGAPPTIPHPVSTQSAAGCLACHGEGIRIGDRFASKMCHVFMTNCTQCHVEQVAVENPLQSDFVGLFRAGPGLRASPGAPPVIPHESWMRENCNSCHGTIARPGLRTTHPWLTNCVQCHGLSAHLDQREFVGVK